MASSPHPKLTIKQLPLYEGCCGGKSCKPKVEPPSTIEPYVTSAREECENVINPIVGDYPQMVREQFNTAVKFTKDSIDYLQDENNQAARAAYITGVGFLGFMIGRKGIIRRTTYGLIGAAAAASLCNPQLAKDYAEVSYALTKQKLTELYSQYGGMSYEDVKKLNWNPFEADSKEPPKPK